MQAMPAPKYRPRLFLRLLTLLSDTFTNLKLTDMETCYKVFRREVLQRIEIKSNRFGFESTNGGFAGRSCRAGLFPLSRLGMS